MCIFNYGSHDINLNFHRPIPAATRGLSSSFLNTWCALHYGAPKERSAKKVSNANFSLLFR